MSVQGLVWTYQTTTTAVEVYQQIDRLRATSNDNLTLSFPKTQAWMLMRSRMQPTLYYPEYVCSHHLRRYRFTHRQQGQGSWDAITAWHASLCQQTSINGVLSTMSQKTMNNHGCKMTSLSHWRWSFHASINEVPSSTIKMASSKEEQFSTTPLEEKDHQGRTRVCISNEHQFINQEPMKIKKDWRRRICNCPHHYLLDRMVQRKVKCKGEVQLNGPKINEPSPTDIRTKDDEQYLRT